MNLSKHKVLITGGSKGIGFELAKRLVALGNRVIICSRHAESLAIAKNEISELITVQCDIGKEDDLKRLAEFLKSQHADLSLIINNAGISLNYDFTKTDVADTIKNVDKELTVNLNALIKLCAVALPLLKKFDNSGIVNISSGLAICPSKGNPVYCASKAAVYIFSQALRYQLEDNLPNIKVFGVLLPMVDTEMTQRKKGKKMSAKKAAEIIIDGIQKNQFEMYIGKSKLLFWLNRWFPSFARNLVRDNV